MKYIKKFEKTNRDIKKGDYAKLNFQTLNSELNSFFRNNFCKIIETNGYSPIWFKFGFQYIPDELVEFFNKQGKYYVYHIQLSTDDVVDYARTIEDLELKLSTKKFNL